MRQLISLTALVLLVALAQAQTGTGQSSNKPDKPKGTTTSTSSSSGGGTTSSTGTSRPEKSGLEKALEEALKNNPDLSVAAAKVRESEAILARARLQVTQKVVTAYQVVEVSKATVGVCQQQLQRLQRISKTTPGGVTQAEVTTAEQDLTTAKARLATATADLNYLLGKSSGKVRLWDPDGKVLGETGRASDTLARYYYAQRVAEAHRAMAWHESAAADKIRKVLDQRVTMKFSDTPAHDVLKMIAKEAQGLHIQANTKAEDWNQKMTATLSGVPLGAVLQLLEDTLPDHQIAVRSYGLLFTTRSHLPAGAVLLSDFWQGGVKSDSKTTKAQDPTGNLPPSNVEGKVNKVGDGLVTLSIGSDAGLAKGHTLEVYRLGPTPRYLGRLSIIEVTPKQAVARVLGRAVAEIKEGDQVTSRIVGAK